MSKADDAKSTAVFYFQTLYEANGLEWTSDNTQEIEEMIDAIISAARKEAAQ